MIIGSIRLDMASTASSTSCSKNQPPCRASSRAAPDSSPMATIWITMLGNRLVFCMEVVRLVPVDTSL